MGRFIIATFLLLGWAFYEMSGGAEFEPASARLANIKTDPLKPSADLAKVDRQAEPVEVTRVSLDLTSVEDVLAGRTRQPARLPQQDQTVAATEDDTTEPQGDSVIILPSLIAGAAPEPEVAVVQVAAASASTEVNFNEVRTVSGNRVNVRGGPGTDYGVVGKLVRGDRVEILEDNGSGWVRFVAEDGETSGWLADFLLSN